MYGIHVEMHGIHLEMYGIYIESTWNCMESMWNLWNRTIPCGFHLECGSVKYCHFRKSESYCPRFCIPSHLQHSHFGRPGHHPTLRFAIMSTCMLVFANMSLTALVFAVPATHTPTFPFWQAWPLPKSKPYCPRFCIPSHLHPDIPVLAGLAITQLSDL